MFKESNTTVHLITQNLRQEVYGLTKIKEINSGVNAVLESRTNLEEHYKVIFLLSSDKESYMELVSFQVLEKLARFMTTM